MPVREDLFQFVVGQLRMWYDLMRPHKVNETALADITAQIAEGMGDVGLLLEGRV